MPRASAAKTALPDRSRRALKQLGRDLATARVRRRIPQQLMADRMLISRGTLRRLETGDPTVGLGVLASALFVLGLSGRLEQLLAPDLDRAGVSEELARLPKHAHAPASRNLDF
jgi:transcriptional regulator with XRE-family HTH domain